MPRKNAQTVKKVDQKVMQELLSARFQPQASVWTPEAKLVDIDEWDNEVKTIVPATGKPYQINEASFQLEGVDFNFAFRSGVEPGDGDIQVWRFRAAADFTCTNGKVIKKGDTKIMVLNAE